ncbi:MAG: sigma-70 family RNA polymerase sigma factor [Balneolaceae bacterium]|nr:sigma-70 family RNA polymerase sigma factor [Balneolaceae bacterium]
MEQDKISSKEFYELITSAETSEVNRISYIFIKRMALYLSTVMKADEETAKDCAQQAFEKVYKKIVNETISEINDVFGYLIRSARNEYLMILRKDKVEVPSEYSYFSGVIGSSGNEIEGSIYSEEKEKLLEYCIKKLKKGKRTFFLQVLKFINEDDKEVAKKLNMSHGNFRTKKSRVVDKLRECVKNTTKDE